MQAGTVCRKLLRMKDQILSRAHTVATSAQAGALADPLRRRILLSLIPRPRSVAELAASEGIELKRLHYHVGALVRIGLLTVTGERRRAGRPIKSYRAVAEAFFVPQGLAEAAPGDALAVELRQSLRMERERTHAGTLFYSEDGRPRMRPVAGRTNASTAFAAEHWQLLRLSKDQAARLLDELARCVAACADQPPPSRGATCLVHIAIAPTASRPP